jgi:hypothetical protein
MGMFPKNKNRTSKSMAQANRWNRKKMSQPKPTNARRIQVNFRLGSAEHKRMKKAARDADRTVADFVRHAVNAQIALNASIDE